MKLCDVNILIYAHREDQAHHRYFRDRLESAVEEPTGIAFSPLVAAGFVRIVTNPRFPNGPTPLDQALAVIDSLAALGTCRWVNPSRQHWQLTSELCRACRCVGKNVADAQHAALAIEHGCTWITRDHDFGRFVPHGLRWEHWDP